MMLDYVKSYLTYKISFLFYEKLTINLPDMERYDKLLLPIVATIMKGRDTCVKTLHQK